MHWPSCLLACMLAALLDALLAFFLTCLPGSRHICMFVCLSRPGCLIADLLASFMHAHLLLHSFLVVGLCKLACQVTCLIACLLQCFFWHVPVWFLYECCWLFVCWQPTMLACQHYHRETKNRLALAATKYIPHADPNASSIFVDSAIPLTL